MKHSWKVTAANEPPALGLVKQWGDIMKGAILVGGRSRRMLGPDKAALRRGGERVLERSLRLLQGVCAEAVLVARDAEHAAEFHKLSLAPVVVDPVPGCGPLAGLYSAINACCDDVFLLGCDLPYLESSLLQKVALEFLHYRPLAVLPLSRDSAQMDENEAWRAEPLCSAWSADCVQAAFNALSKRELSLTVFARNLNTRYLRLNTEEGEQLRNINTPEDLAASGGELDFSGSPNK
jgi:molybdopterin-guanine dinucleotide biosynthesis protein A